MSIRDYATKQRRAYIREVEQSERNGERLRAWWRRWYDAHGRLPDICAHRRQIEARSLDTASILFRSTGPLKLYSAGRHEWLHVHFNTTTGEART